MECFCVDDFDPQDRQKCRLILGCFRNAVPSDRYNPYSLIKAFYDKEFGSYWYETGTPTFLVKRLKETRFEPHRFTDRTLYANSSMLKDYSAENPDPIPLLYQTGCLTIADYDAFNEGFKELDESDA